MIPKKIHCCWFGRNPKPELAIKCIESWKKYCPDYEIIEWNEDNFDIGAAPLYVRQAYENKKWAFVTDYVRLWALVNFGGIYMDTDVEVIKSLDCFLHHKAVSGFENETQIPTGLMASQQDFPLFVELMHWYDTASFILEDGSLNTTTNVSTITNQCKDKGFIPNGKYQEVDGFALYPKEFFCPKDYATGKVKCTRNTYAIHHFDGSWQSEEQKKMVRDYFRNLPRQLRRNRILAIVKKIVGETVYKKLVSVKRNLEKLRD